MGFELAQRRRVVGQGEVARPAEVPAIDPLDAALIILAAAIDSLGLALLGGRALGLSRPQLGTVMLVAGFGLRPCWAMR